jgi:putative transposase
MKYFDKFHPDNFYHIYNHAVGNENLFKKHDNFIFFLNRYNKYISPVAKTFSYCLMPNHFHILIQVRDEKTIRLLAKNDDDEFDFHKFIMQQLSNFLNSYAKAFNKQHNRRGALFLDFTRRKEIKDEFYFSRLINYIHQNPVHHGFCKSPTDWDYSSYNTIISVNKNSKLERKAVFNWFGGVEEFIAFHKREGFIDLDL